MTMMMMMMNCSIPSINLFSEITKESLNEKKAKLPFRMHQWLNLPLQSDHFCWSKFPPAILNYQKIHGGISLCAVTGRWVATFNISSLSALSKWHTQLDWHAAKVADNAMVKLKKHSNTTVRKCGFDVQSNSPHDTWPRRRCGGAMVTRQGSEFKGGMVIFDAGKGPRSLLWMSCVLLVGGMGANWRFHEKTKIRVVYIRSWAFQKNPKSIASQKKWVVDR